MAAARLAQSLGAAADQRAAAYTELTALAHGDAPDATTGLATATLHIGGLEGEALEDEAQLAAKLGTFGDVLAVTLRERREAGKVSWALVTYAEAAESERALEGAAAELGAESVVVRRMDTQQALGSTGAMNRVMVEQRRRVEVRVAASCVGPLIETVLCADAAEVDAEEFQRASLLLCSLCRMDREVSAEYFRNGRFYAVWTASGNAFNAAAAKDPAELTRNDVMTLACECGGLLVNWTQGFTDQCARAGLDEFGFFGPCMEHHPLLPARSPGDDLPRAVALRCLEICRDPQGASSEAVAFALQTTIFGLGAGRESVAAALVEAGLLEVAVAHLHQSSPVEWVNWRSGAGLGAGVIFSLAGNLAGVELPGMNKVQLYVDSGMADAIASLLKAYELRGAAKVDEANVIALTNSMWGLSLLDLTAPEARPIVRLLEGMASALRFGLEHSLDQVKAMGFTSASFYATACALVFGKLEDGGDFDFSQTLVNDITVGRREFLTGSLAAFNPSLPACYFRPLVHLCISDANKAMLIQCDVLIPTLIDALFLDPEHPCKDMDEKLRAGIQRDGAECFLQLALFEPGKELLEQRTEALDALRALADGAALTEEARRTASSALAAVEGLVPVPDLTPGDEKHVMVSYQWDVQATIKRLVASLKKRGYVVWFDLESMKGSVVDAMSDAIDNAEVMLYAVSEKYKESGNCRLEANYAHQQDVDMIPLMAQEGFKAKGWLGLLLSTRLWYPFHGCEDEDDAAFEERVDPVAREIGDRGKASAASVSEGVPPSAAPTPRQSSPRARAPAPAPAPAPGPAPAPEPAPAPAAAPARAPATPKPLASVSTPERSFTPSMQASPQPGVMGTGGGMSAGSFAELSTFIKDQQMLLLERTEQTRKETEAKMEARMEEQRQQIEELKTPQEAISAQQVEALTARLQALHAAQMLSDDELFAMEDCVADFLEAKASYGVLTLEAVHAHRALSKVHKLLALGEGVADDAMFARQLRRKFV